jgi:hypothetical protein
MKREKLPHTLFLDTIPAKLPLKFSVEDLLEKDMEE